MDMKRFFLYASVIAALALAGCGGNGGNGMAGGGNGNGNGNGTPPPPPPGPTVADLFETAQNARDDAEVAVTDATNAVEAAMENSDKLDVYSVMGNSMMAQTNAQSVLDARTKANDAVTTTETAVSHLEQAETDAAEHNNDALNNAIAAALEVAQQAVTDSEARAASDDLKAAVEKVTGTDVDDVQTPTDIQEGVAMAIGMAFMPAEGSTTGAGQRVMHTATMAAAATARATTAAPNPVTADDVSHGRHGQSVSVLILGPNRRRSQCYDKADCRQRFMILNVVKASTMTENNSHIPTLDRGR